MTSYLIEGGVVVDPISQGVDQKDLLVVDGKFKDTTNKKNTKTEIISAKGKYILPGLFDLRCHLSQPGVSFQKSVEKIGKKAAAGGYTSLLAMPELSSKADNPESLRFTKDSIINEEQVKVYLSGCLTMESAGKNLAPIGSLQEAGIVAVTDCPHTPQDNQIFIKAVEYATMFNLPVIDMPRDLSLSPEGQIHEGLMSLKMGLKGIPRIAEEMFVARAILLSKYSRSKIHLTSISSKGSVEQIRKAKREGISVTCDVTSNHLFCNEEYVENFDSLAKAEPPFREEIDREELVCAIIDETIDAISTGHKALSLNDKSKEFDLAPSGTIGLENAFLQAVEVIDSPIDKKLLTLAKTMSYNPSKVLNIEPTSFKTGSSADFFIFDINGETTLKRENEEIGGVNLPFKEKKFAGRVCKTFVNGKISYPG